MTNASPKETLYPNPQHPEPGQFVHLMCALNADPDPIFDEEKSILMHLGDDALSPVLEELITTMQTGEVRTRSLAPSDLPGLYSPIASQVAITVKVNGAGTLGELLDPAACDEKAHRSLAMLQAAIDDRQCGNSFLKDGKLLDAKRFYCCSITRCKRLLEKPSAHRDPAQECLLNARSNLALCYFRLGKFRQCVRQCNKVLKCQATNIKALYRRAQARHGLEEHETAMQDVERCLEMDPSNTEAQKLRQKIAAAQQRNTLKERSLYKGMFGSPVPSQSNDTAS
jgi:hypothetical protein